MLSLAKLRGGTGATYWLAQAQGRVTHADSVSSGVEDYYLAGPEAAGQWIGGGVAGLGLGGEVEEVALTRLLDRQHPHTGEALPRPRRGRPPEVDGFDLMFSVPKSASVLFGLGDPRAQGAVARAQRAAVEEAMRYLDREACLVRVGPERELQRGGGLVGAAFEHRTSRAGDPQLHTHVLVANGTFRGDGAWVALDGTAIYHHARAAGHIHEAAFRRALALELGVEWGRAHNGIADIERLYERAAAGVLDPGRGDRRLPGRARLERRRGAADRRAAHARGQGLRRDPRDAAARVARARPGGRAGRPRAAGDARPRALPPLGRRGQGRDRRSAGGHEWPDRAGFEL